MSLNAEWEHKWDYIMHKRGNETRYRTAAAKSPLSCPTLCNPIDGSPPGSPVPGILQARTLEWVAISFNAWKWSHSRVQLLATPWTAAYQTPPSMGFSRQEYWSGLPLPSPKWPSRSNDTLKTSLSKNTMKLKGKPKNREKISTICIADKWIISRLFKEQLQIKKER